MAYATPAISRVEPTSLSDTSFIITWSTTNETSSTEILWGSGGLTNITTVAALSNTGYHRVALTGLYQNTTYQYRLKSGSAIFPPLILSPLSFTTLTKPSGEYLFSFAVLNDLRYAEGKANTKNARGIPYEFCAQIISSEVANINSHVDPNGRSGVAFTVVNGNLAESSGTFGDQVGSNTFLKSKLDQLTGASDYTSDISYKYLPVPGYQDKQANYTTDWITNSFGPLTAPTSIEEIYGYNAASSAADSVFNYQFKYKYYNFLFLDSVKSKANGATGSANLANLYGLLSAESGSKTFIFTSYPAYNPLSSATKDYPLDIPTSEVGGSLYIDNHAAFRATLEAFKDVSGNPIVAAVISGQLGDNYLRDINGISYVRQGPALQYPTGYSIYKVYSTGYIKTFYKTTGASQEAGGDFKPWVEFARDQISSETVSGTEVVADVLQQFWLGSSSYRNFTYEYAFIPGLAPSVISTGPVSGEARVNLNAPILITFNKRMATNNLGQITTISDGSATLPVSAESFIDASRTVLKVTHPDFTIDKTYTITVNASKVVDEGLTLMAANYSFSFNTNNATKDVAPPSANVAPLADNATTDPFPIFIGVATDESRIIKVEYRFKNSAGNWLTSWTTAEAVDGQFSGTTEVFQIIASNPLSADLYQIWLRTSDGADNISAGFLAYAFTVAIADRPALASLKLDSNRLQNGDPINALPKIEITLTSNTSLESQRVSLGARLPARVPVKVDTNYYVTYEVTPALADGLYCLTVEAFDISGNALTYEVYPLYVQSAASVAVQGTPLNYPNPFDPGTQTTDLGYTLTKPSNITISVFDLAGNQIKKIFCPASTAGGRAGYNTVTWDGKSDSGSYVGNGLYVYLILADGQVIQDGKGKITVFKR